MAINRSYFVGLFYTLSLISTHAYSAANLYDWTFTSDLATPPHVVGTTQYNNQTYSRATTININNANIKSLILSTVKNRLFQTNTGFNTSSVSKLQSKLIEDGYFLEKSSATIYKDVYPNRTCNYFNSKRELVNFSYSGNTGTTFECPFDAARAASVKSASNYSPQRSYTFIGWASEAINYSDNNVTARYSFKYNNSDYVEQISVSRVSVHAEQVLPNRIYMTEDNLYSRVLDTANFDLIDAFKAFSNYEKLNNHAYLYLTELLMPLEPVQTDIELINNGNGDSGSTPPGGNGLPTNTSGETMGFCSWAITVCNFFDYVKEEPPESNPATNKITYKDTERGHYWTDYFAQNALCPAPVTKEIMIMGQSWTYSFEYTLLCEFFQKISNYMLFAAYFISALIVAGVRSV